MVRELKKLYFIGMIPALVIFIGLGILLEIKALTLPKAPMQMIVAPLIFVAAVTTGIALPIWLRTLFAHQRKNQVNGSSADFLRFQRRILYCAMASPYFALAAFILTLPPFHLYGTVLAALYAVYYYFPTEKRIRYDRQIFKIQPLA